MLQSGTVYKLFGVCPEKNNGIYIYETNQNLGGYNGLYRQRYDLGSSQPWGTQIFWPPVTGDLHHLKRSGGCYTFTMKHSTIQDPLPNSQKHPRATCSRCPNCRKLTFSPPRNAMIPGISKLFSGFLLQPWGVATRSVERPLATARSTSPGGACDARGRTWEVSPQVRLSSTSS